MQDDLAIFLALIEQGTTGRAAARCRVSQPTVVRRIAALERHYGLTLFDRGPSGYAPTEAARALCEDARFVATARRRFDDHASALREGDEGEIRVTFLDDFRRQMLPAFRRFGERWPHVRLKLLPGYEMVDLATGEADIALRGMTAPDDDMLVVHELPRPGWAIYVAARADRVPQRIARIDPARVAGIEGPPGRLRPFDLLREHAAAHGSNLAEYPSYSALISAIGSGIAVSALPIAMGDPEPELRRAFFLDEPVETLPTLYLVGRRSARRRRPVRELFDDIVASFEEDRVAFTGRPD